jgi:hypothetical protein
MLEAVQQFLLNTPWWVYLVLALILYRGIRATKTRVVTISKLFILPILLILLSAHTVLTMTTLTSMLALNLLVTILIGFLIGWYTTKMLDIKVDHAKGLMQLQGSWFFLWMLIVIFACKYYQGYVSNARPDLAQSLSYIHIMFAIHGVLMGLLVERLAHYIYCYKTKPTVNLEKLV